VECFSNGDTSHNHQPATHPFRVIEQNSVPIYDKNWGADEELLLLEGAEIYGLGSWADIADHIGGYRSKDEVRDHYMKAYISSSKFPLPELASPHNLDLLEEMPREEFQARKKRRIESRKDAAKNAPPAQPKTKPTASVPACHEVQGYMPGRLEFETEFANEAEEAVQHMQFDPGDGINPRTGEMEPEMDLKITVMDIYNSRLTARAERKKVIFEHNLLEYKKNSALDKKRTKEERDLLMKAKPFARMMNHDDFEDLCKGLIDELNLRQAVAQLQDWRQMRIGDLKTGEKYEQEKVQHAQKAQPMGSLDRERFATSQRSKAALVIETPSGAAALIAPELPIRLQLQANGHLSGAATPSGVSSPAKGLANGHATNGTSTPQKSKPAPIAPVSGVTPLPSLSIPAASTSSNSKVLAEPDIPFTDSHLLTPPEVELCKLLRLHPKPYLVLKEQILKEAMRGNGQLKKKNVRELWKGLDGGKGARLWEVFVGWGWIGKA
jgi:transcriptional adapter 2-alpha